MLYYVFIYACIYLFTFCINENFKGPFTMGYKRETVYLNLLFFFHYNKDNFNGFNYDSF